MPLSAVLMVLVVMPTMFLLGVVAILLPGPLARLNAAGLRNAPLPGPRSMREQAATNSTPGMMRFWGVCAVGMSLVIGSHVVRKVLDEGIEESAGGDPWMAWPIYGLGAAQIIFGLCVLVWSRRIFERLSPRFEQDGAPLRRWMVIVVGALGVLLGAVALFVAVSLA